MVGGSAHKSQSAGHAGPAPRRHVWGVPMLRLCGLKPEEVPGPSAPMITQTEGCCNHHTEALSSQGS